MVELLPAVLAFIVGVLVTVLLMRQSMRNHITTEELKHERKIARLEDRLRVAQ